jgi:hypothetical protein
MEAKAPVSDTQDTQHSTCTRSQRAQIRLPASSRWVAVSAGPRSVLETPCLWPVRGCSVGGGSGSGSTDRAVTPRRFPLTVPFAVSIIPCLQDLPANTSRKGGIFAQEAEMGFIIPNKASCADASLRRVSPRRRSGSGVCAGFAWPPSAIARATRVSRRKLRRLVPCQR